MISLTKDEENRKMLATVLGIDEEEAARRLDTTVLVTAASDSASQRIAGQVLHMLDRTVRGSFEARPTPQVTVEVIVGTAAPRTVGVPQVWLGSAADGIRISNQPFDQVLSSEHAIFGLIAASYACGMALRFALGRKLAFPGSDAILVSPRELLGEDLDLLDLPCLLGEAVLAGAGAVGNGFLYGLQYFKPVGRLHIVDPKHVHDGILNRCVWFTCDDLNEAKATAIVARAQGAFPSLKLVPQVKTVKELTREADAPALERLITTVDSRRARRALQTEIPREIFDASTTDITEVVLHFNQQPSDLACLSCIYRRERGEVQHEAHVAEVLGVSVDDVRESFISQRVANLLCARFPELTSEEVEGKAYDTLFKARCSEGKLLTPADRQVVAPFCFVSVLAGAFLALEFVRRLNTGRIATPFNYWRLSPWYAPVNALRALRPIADGCEYCSESVMRETATGLWGAMSASR
jgi:E1 N-terminal domain